MVYSSKDFNYVDFCRDSAKYASIMAFAFEKVLQLCREKGEQYGSRRLRLKLTAIYYLGKFRYAWVVMAILKRMKHPGLVRRDIRRVRGERLEIMV